MKQPTKGQLEAVQTISTLVKKLSCDLQQVVCTWINNYANCEESEINSVLSDYQYVAIVAENSQIVEQIFQLVSSQFSGEARTILGEVRCGLETESQDSGIEVEKRQYVQQLKQQLLRKIYVPKPEKQIAKTQTMPESTPHYPKRTTSYSETQPKYASNDALIQKAMLQYMQKSTRQHPAKAHIVQQEKQPVVRSPATIRINRSNDSLSQYFSIIHGGKDKGLTTGAQGVNGQQYKTMRVPEPQDTQKCANRMVKTQPAEGTLNLQWTDRSTKEAALKLQDLSGGNETYRNCNTAQEFQTPNPLELSTIAGVMEQSRAPMDTEILGQAIALKHEKLRELQRQQTQTNVLVNQCVSQIRNITEQMQTSASLIRKYTADKYGNSTSSLLQQMLVCQRSIAGGYKSMQTKLPQIMQSVRALHRCCKYKLRKLSRMNALLEALTQLEILKKLQRLDAFSSANLRLYQQALMEEKGKLFTQLQLYQEIKKQYPEWEQQQEAGEDQQQAHDETK